MGGKSKQFQNQLWGVCGGSTVSCAPSMRTHVKRRSSTAAHSPFAYIVQSSKLSTLTQRGKLSSHLNRGGWLSLRANHPKAQQLPAQFLHSTCKQDPPASASRATAATAQATGRWRIILVWRSVTAAAPGPLGAGAAACMRGTERPNCHGPFRFAEFRFSSVPSCHSGSNLARQRKRLFGCTLE